MPSEKFRINTNGQSLRNPSNGFFGMTLSPNLTIDESDVSANNDRRSAHNALERQRREHLNVKFQQLAHALPSLQTVRRPSKTMIVAKSLEFVSSSLKRESNYTSEIQKLREENERLRKQAQAASQKLKKQLSESELQAVKVEKEDTLSCKTLVEETSTSEKKRSSSKRKLSDAEPSPPPTPSKTVVINNNTPKKKRMVKQTKSTAQESTSTFTTNSMIVGPFNHMPPYPIQHQNNYFDITPPPYNQDLFNYPHEEQQQQNFQPMMNPMLLAPYYEIVLN